MTVVAEVTSAHAQRNKRTSELRRQRMYARLIEAGITVLSERGLDAPVIDDFIVAAGISRGSYYNYFKTKEDLVDAVADHLRDGLMRANEAMVKLIEDPAERLAWSARRIIRFAALDARVRLLLLSEGRRASPFETAWRRGPKRDIRAAIRAGLLPRQDAEIAVDFMTGAVREAAKAAIVYPRAPDHAEQTARMILVGLGMEADAAREVANRHLHDLDEAPATT